MIHFLFPGKKKNTLIEVLPSVSDKVYNTLEMLDTLFKVPSRYRSASTLTMIKQLIMSNE